MTQENARLSSAQQRAIQALLVNSTISGAAIDAGVNRRTLARWLQDATFCDVLRQAESEALAATLRRLSTLSASAIDALADSLRDKTAPALRLKAADLVLSRLTPMKELVDFERRLSALENSNHAIHTATRTH